MTAVVDNADGPSRVRRAAAARLHWQAQFCATGAGLLGLELPALLSVRVRTGRDRRDGNAASRRVQRATSWLL